MIRKHKGDYVVDETITLTASQAWDLFDYIEHELNREDVENNYPELDLETQCRVCSMWEKKIRQQENKYELLDLAYDEVMGEMNA